MLKKQYSQHKKHLRYFSLYWSFQDTELTTVMIVASKKGVHKHAVKRNFAKRRLRAALKSFLKTETLPPAATIKIVAKKEILTASFEDLNLMLHQNLKALSA